MGRAIGLQVFGFRTFRLADLRPGTPGGGADFPNRALRATDSGYLYRLGRRVDGHGAQNCTPLIGHLDAALELRPWADCRESLAMVSPRVPMPARR